jgi:prevent-host-death family protein
MKFGIRELKGGELSRAIHRARVGEDVVVTDRGKPVARIVPFEAVGVPTEIAGLVASRGLEYRVPILDDVVPVPMTSGDKTAVDYVLEQRR